MTPIPLKNAVTKMQNQNKHTRIIYFYRIRLEIIVIQIKDAEPKQAHAHAHAHAVIFSNHIRLVMSGIHQLCESHQKRHCFFLTKTKRQNQLLRVVLWSLFYKLNESDC